MPKQSHIAFKRLFSIDNYGFTNISLKTTPIKQSNTLQPNKNIPKNSNQKIPNSYTKKKKKIQKKLFK